MAVTNPSDQNEATSTETPIAIVGCGLRLPGKLYSLDDLWQFLLQSGDGIGDLPEGRWLNDLYDPQHRIGRTYVRRAGFVDGLDMIDTSFMGVSPKEASQIDPQQRMLIETSFEALEMAGLPLSTLSKTRTGVFVGISSNDYIQSMTDDPRGGNAYTNTGGALSIAANRISYLFDLRGPSLAIDTACSSGLTALDHAVRSMRQGACEVAIVGAANALIRSEPFAGFCAATMLSPAAQCRAFDADGQGFVRAEGAVSFVLKPLAVALRDNDPILGVVHGSDTNNDGRTSGLSLPNGDAQEELIRRVFDRQGINPDNIVYVEAHGTGTAAGDPIEAGAIGRAIGQNRSTAAPLLMGSIKSNIGHLEPASGLAGLAKALLCLRNREVPPSLHFETPNPAIDFEALRLQVPQETTKMQDTGGPAMVAVNSFGFGGANAHAVVSEAPTCEMPDVQAPASPWIVVSGRSVDALRDVAQGLDRYIQEAGEDVPFGQFCGTLLTRRSWHSHRAVIWGDTLPELQTGLKAVAEERDSERVLGGTAITGARTAFVFTGNGPQWWGMGRQLLQDSDLFRTTLEEVDAVFRKVSDLKLIDEMMLCEDASRMALTEIAQPALFGLQVGLVRCLAAQGLTPDATVGHSAGELAAAYCAGQFDLETIVRVISARSQEQSKTAGAGAMAAIGLNTDAAQAILDQFDGLVIAGDNGPEAVSVAGPSDSIDKLVERLGADGSFATRLPLDYAFHSPAMDPIEHSFRARVDDVVGQIGDVPFYSTVTGEAIQGSQMDADYWWRNLRDPVQFRPAINRMTEDGYNVFVEVGPHPNLLGYVKGTARTASRNIRTVETLRRETNETLHMRRALATAVVSGCEIDLSKHYSDPVPPLDLPRYPWQRERHYNDVFARPPVAALPTHHAFLGQRISLGKDVWHGDIALSRIPFVADHQIRESVLFPATGFMETAIAAGRSLGMNETIELRTVRIEKALVLTQDREVGFETFLDRTDHSLSIRSRSIAEDSSQDAEAEPFTEHMRAVLESRPTRARTVDLEALRARMSRGYRTASEHYALTSARGLNYGPLFQTVSGINLGHGELLAELHRTRDHAAGFTIDPMMTDGALQAMIGLIDVGEDRRLYLPVALDRLVVHGDFKTCDTAYAHIVTRGANRFYLSADITLIATDGSVIAEMHGMQVRSVGAFGGVDALHLHHRLKPLTAFDASLAAIDPAALMPSKTDPLFAARRDLIAEYDRALEELCAIFVADAFHRISDGAPFDLDSLAAEGHLAKEHSRYAQTILDHAVTFGTVTLQDHRYHATAQDESQTTWNTMARRYPEYGAELFLTARIWQHLPALLRGDRQLLDMLFPASGSPLMEQIYEQGFTSAEANHTLAKAVAQAVAQMPTERPVRILEVGGGTGGTTARILAEVDPTRVEYVFTDVSPDFLSRAERRFARVPSFRTAPLDLSKPVDLKALGGQFDIVIGANVIHATANIRNSLGAVHKLLQQNGLIGLIEIERHGYFDFFFGLLPGVWGFSDHDDRPEHALLTGQAWQSVMTEEGFAQTALWSDASAQNSATCSVLLGRKSDTQDTVDPAAQEQADSGPWLIIAPAFDNALGQTLLAAVQASDGEARLVSLSGAAPHEPDEPTDETAWTSLCKEMAAAPPKRIVMIAPSGGIADLPDTDAGWPLVSLIKAAAQADWGTGPRIDIVTENVLDEQAVDLTGGSYWAVGRTIVNEQSSWPCRRIDWTGTPTALCHLADLLLAAPGTYPQIPENADELRVTETGILANMIAPVAPANTVDAEQAPFAVTLRGQGSLDNLLLRQTPAPDAPDEGMVEISLKAAGLNFKDIILALGLLPPELLKDSPIGPLMGLEGAGVVSRVGPGVTSLSEGDRVMLMSEGCFASSITVPEHAAQKLPDGWSFAQAATVPVVGLTVVYALDIVARLQPEETILIHGGAGGVGLMAIQYAKSIGAKVIATAGSDEKRDLLRLLDVDCVSESRTLQFEEDVRAFTNGEGVDVVLNSLAGDAMLASLDVLKPFGRFIEIGKRDFEANNRLNLRALEQNVSYFAVDLTFLPRHKPRLFAEAWQRLLDACASGAVRPLPLRVYGLSGLREAFRLMQGGRHIGKLVLDLDSRTAPIEPLAKPPLRFASEGVHLIAGGLGGIGLKVAAWMAGRGAKVIALAGRSGITTDEQTSGVAAIEAAGAKVVIVQADVTDAQSVEQMVANLIQDHGKISGVMNAVLVLDDRLMTNMDHAAFEAVMRPKVLGAYHLHHATQHQTLDYFLAFSSLANLVGNPGQSNYVAANAYLEQLVLARRGAGQPGLALELGAVADAGVLERDEALRANLNKSIGGAITVADIVDAIDALLIDGPPVAAVVQATGRFGGPIMQTARAEALLGQMEAQQDMDADKVDFAQIPVQERVAVMEQTLVQIIAKVMGAKESQIDPERSLSDAGLDSLMAVEFALAVETRVGASIPSSELSEGRSLRDISALLLGRLNLEFDTSGDTQKTPSAKAALMLEDATLPQGYGAQRAPDVPVRKRNAILLTGATGFLGSFILDALAQKGAQRIICLGRGRDRPHAEDRLRAALRKAGLSKAEAQVGQTIEVWPSDLAIEGLGLADQQHAELVDTVDLVVHNAADVNFLGGYEDMRAVNVRSLHQLLDLCQKGRPKSLHFVSTLRIYADLDQIRGNAISEDVAPALPPEAESGYVKTKWVADTLVQRARELGLSASVYRPSFVIGRTTDGYSNVSDLGSALARFALDTQMLPKVEVSLPIVPVDTAANRIVEFIDTPGEQVGTRHITDWPALSMQEIRDISQRQGASVELLPVDLFVEKAIAFMEKNPGHPAVWLPSFFASGAPNNMLGAKLTKPVLPTTEVTESDEGRQTLARMVHWFQEAFEPES